MSAPQALSRIVGPAPVAQAWFLRPALRASSARKLRGQKALVLSAFDWELGNIGGVDNDDGEEAAAIILGAASLSGYLSVLNWNLGTGWSVRGVLPS